MLKLTLSSRTLVRDGVGMVGLRDSQVSLDQVAVLASNKSG